MKSLFLILFLVVFLLFVPSVAFPQVHIREKISITPVPSFQKTASESPLPPLFEIDSTFYGPPLYGAIVIGEIDGEINVTFTFSTTVSGTQSGSTQYRLQELPPFSSNSRIWFTTSLPPGGSGTFGGSFTRYPGFVGFCFGVQGFGFLFPTTVSLNATTDTVTFLYEYDLLPDYLSLSGRIVLSGRRVSSGIDHFEVKTQPDTVRHGESALITATAKDAQNNDVDLDGSTLLTLTIDDTQYGMFISAAGDTVASPLDSVLYSDAHSGKIKFTANKTNPIGMEPRKVTVTVVKADDASKNGTGSIFVKEFVKIKLVLDNTELRPMDDSDNKKADPACTVPKGKPDTCYRIIDYSKVRKTTAKVTVTDFYNRPVKDYSFTIKALVKANSGGHDHLSDRPSGRFVTTKQETLKTVQDITGTDGTVHYTYLSSGIGGIDSIYLKGTTEKDTATALITLKIANLLELGSGTKYVLVGAYGEPGVNSQHKKNHFGTNNLVNKLKALADSVHSDSSYILRFNDMSLQCGGPFDISNNWNTPHQKHREGVSTDVDNIDNNNKEILAAYLKKKLQIIDPNATLGNEGNHYHATIR